MRLGYFYKMTRSWSPWIVWVILISLPLSAASAGIRGALAIEHVVVTSRRATSVDTAKIEKWKKVLRYESSYKVRLRAVMLLGRAGGPDIITILGNVVDSDPHYAVRAGAVMALGGMGLPQAVPVVLNSAAMDMDGFVREQARRTLAKFNRPSAIPFVVATSDSEDLRVRKEVLSYLSKAWSSKADTVLIRALGDFPEVLRLAKKILSQFPAKRQLNLLRKAAENSSTSIRVGAIRFLSESAIPEATDLILEVYQRDSEDDAVREVVQQALRNKREQLPVASIILRATSVEEAMDSRARALTLLGIIGGTKAEETLLGALKEESILLRGTAVIALGKIGNPAHLATLEAMAESLDNQRIYVHLRSAIRQLSSKLPAAMATPAAPEAAAAVDTPEQE